MNEIIEFEAPIDVIDPELDKYDDIILFPEKLQRAKEMLAKHGLPKPIQDRIDKIKREKSFWVRGILTEADADNLSFSLVGKAAGSKLETT